MSNEQQDEKIQSALKNKIGILINDVFKEYDYAKDAELDDLTKKYFDYIKTGNQRIMLNVELALEAKVERIKLISKKKKWTNAKTIAKSIITKLMEFAVTLLFTYLKESINKK